MKSFNISKALLIGIISLIVVNVSVLIYHKFSDKDITIPQVKLKEKNQTTDENNIFAIMLEQSDGTYKATTSTSFNQPGYTYNSEKSGCIDALGNTISNGISYNSSTKSVITKLPGASYCYVYFDIILEPGTQKLINSGQLVNTGLEGDGYRFTGESPKNYICFGASSKEDCLKLDAETAQLYNYIYRIVGVFPDSSGNKHIKIIKNFPLGYDYSGAFVTYMWNDTNTEVSWENSTLYSSLNGAEFLNNSKRMPSGWADKIFNWTWSALKLSGGDDLKEWHPNWVYLLEHFKSPYNSSSYERTTPTAKIGLMYVSDYLLSIGVYPEEETYKISNLTSQLGKSWLDYNSIDKDFEIKFFNQGHDWTITQYGYSSSEYYSAYSAFQVGHGNLYVAQNNSDGTNSYYARPTFYLNSDVVIKSGTGTATDPYILK